ncbi:MAG: hypothetical protein GF404_02320 [candidate division Zixibacteria bacterium]|nr:hypothetical protein [candidate division Zixibacteria bacterium]
MSFMNSQGGGRGDGRGGGQGGRGRNRGAGGQGRGPGGKCVCPGCGAEVAHEMGKPCNAMKCPQCGQMMTRD